jgi:hypothetical protein
MLHRKCSYPITQQDQIGSLKPRSNYEWRDAAVDGTAGPPTGWIGWLGRECPNELILDRTVVC